MAELFQMIANNEETPVSSVKLSLENNIFKETDTPEKVNLNVASIVGNKLIRSLTSISSHKVKLLRDRLKYPFVKVWLNLVSIDDQGKRFYIGKTRPSMVTLKKSILY